MKDTNAIEKALQQKIAEEIRAEVKGICKHFPIYPDDAPMPVYF